MNLKNFRPDETSLVSDQVDDNSSDNPIAGSNYHEEINTLKIDRLSNKITIISIIIPVMIGAILIFAYLDMKERVVDADQTKQIQVDKISQELEEKLNALDVKIAKNRFDIENTLPELTQKTIALDGKLAKVSSSKADVKTMTDEITKLQKQVTNNAGQDKSTLATIERMNTETLSTIKTSQQQFDKTSQQLKDEITLFKEEFDARLLELSDYEQQIGLLGKDLSLLDKKYKRLELEYLTKLEFQTKTDQIRTELAQLKKDHEKQIKEIGLQISRATDKLSAESEALSNRLNQHIDQLSKTIPSTEKKSQTSIVTKPAPQVNIEATPSGEIKQKPLNQ